MSQPISESLAILSASVVPALEDTSNVAAKVLIASSEYVAASHRLDAVLNDAAQIRKNVLPRLRFCQTNDRWAPIWWNLLLLSMPRKHLQPQRLHFRFLKFAMAHRTGLALFLLPFRPFSIDETTRRALLPKRGPCSRPLASSGTRSASSMLAESPAWSFFLTVALVENFRCQVRSSYNRLLFASALAGQVPMGFGLTVFPGTVSFSGWRSTAIEL